MWVLVMFDLPVGTDAERRAANSFRKWLLDAGYERSQYSVYSRFCVSGEQRDRRVREITAAVPRKGVVHILSVTEKQFQDMVVLRSRARRPGKKPPGQFDLF